MRSEDVLNEQFRATKYNLGYDQQEVDTFIERAVHTLRKYEEGQSPEAPTVTAQKVDAVRFTPTQFREGYHQQDVDEFLDKLAEAFQAHERGMQE